MNHTWKLSNHLFCWLMREKGKWTIFTSLGVGLILMLAQAFPKAVDVNDIAHMPKAFLPYEAVVDNSHVIFVFCMGLIVLLVLIARQASAFFHNGKGIYTVFMLPMKRTQIYLSFLLSALAVLVLYFISWLVLMVVLYFPIMSHYANVAAKEVFYVSPELTVQGVDAVRTNGLFLAFRRSMFLSIFFPTSLWQFFVFLCGMLLMITSVLYSSLHLSRKIRIFVVILGSYWGLNVMCIPYAVKDIADITSMGATIRGLSIAILALLILTVLSLRNIKKSIKE